MKWIFDNAGITIVGESRTACIDRLHPQYEEIKKALLSTDFPDDTIFMLLDPEVIKARKALIQNENANTPVIDPNLS